VDIWNGTNTVGQQTFSGFIITITSSNGVYPFVAPLYVGNSNSWLVVDNQSNVTISNFILQHTYNYSTWTGSLSNSSPLISVYGGSTFIVNNVMFVPSNQALRYVNPLIFSSNSGGSVEIKYSSFVNISLNRASLVHDYYSTQYYFTNVTFR
jgi:hypothetical protein